VLERSTVKAEIGATVSPPPQELRAANKAAPLKPIFIKKSLREIASGLFINGLFGNK
jgi:hypothetical protein